MLPPIRRGIIEASAILKLLDSADSYFWVDD